MTFFGHGVYDRVAFRDAGSYKSLIESVSQITHTEDSNFHKKISGGEKKTLMGIPTSINMNMDGEHKIHRLPKALTSHQMFMEDILNAVYIQINLST